jgi:hypothetical protein
VWWWRWIKSHLNSAALSHSSLLREGKERKPEPPHSQSQSAPADIWNMELHSTISDSFAPLCVSCVETHSLIHATIYAWRLHLPAKIHHCWCERETQNTVAQHIFGCIYKGIVWHFVLKWEDMQLFRFHKLNAALDLKKSEKDRSALNFYGVFERVGWKHPTPKIKGFLVRSMLLWLGYKV